MKRFALYVGLSMSTFRRRGECFRFGKDIFEPCRPVVFLELGTKYLACGVVQLRYK